MLRAPQSRVGVLPIDEFDHWVVFEFGVWGRKQFLVVDGIGGTDRAGVLGPFGKKVTFPTSERLHPVSAHQNLLTPGFFSIADDGHPNRHPYGGRSGQNENGECVPSGD